MSLRTGTLCLFLLDICALEAKWTHKLILVELQSHLQTIVYVTRDSITLHTLESVQVQVCLVKPDWSGVSKVSGLS